MFSYLYRSKDQEYKLNALYLANRKSLYSCNLSTVLSLLFPLLFLPCSSLPPSLFPLPASRSLSSLSPSPVFLIEFICRQLSSFYHLFFLPLQASSYLSFSTVKQPLYSCTATFNSFLDLCF